MNTIQAMIILNNGIRKYGTIINGEHEGRIKFIPATEIIAKDESQLTNLIEHIPVENIYSIDTFLK
jgi:hypothetical protein